jgi:hypothetical protein
MSNVSPCVGSCRHSSGGFLLRRSRPSDPLSLAGSCPDVANVSGPDFVPSHAPILFRHPRPAGTIDPDRSRPNSANESGPDFSPAERLAPILSWLVRAARAPRERVPSRWKKGVMRRRRLARSPTVLGALGRSLLPSYPLSSRARTPVFYARRNDSETYDHGSERSACQITLSRGMRSRSPAKPSADQSHRAR